MKRAKQPANRPSISFWSRLVSGVRSHVSYILAHVSCCPPAGTAKVQKTVQQSETVRSSSPVPSSHFQYHTPLHYLPLSYTNCTIGLHKHQPRSLTSKTSDHRKKISHLASYHISRACIYRKRSRSLSGMLLNMVDRLFGPGRQFS